MRAQQIQVPTDVLQYRKWLLDLGKAQGETIGRPLPLPPRRLKEPAGGFQPGLPE